MTCIAAVKDVERIYYGSDSRVTYDEGPCYDVVNKWRIIPGRSYKYPIYIGAAGSSRLDNLIVSSAKNLENATTCFELADMLKKAIANDLWSHNKDDNGDPQTYSVEMIVIFESNLYRISSDLSVTEIPQLEFVAVGSGEPYALGAAYACRNKNGKDRIKNALQAAIKYDPNCGGRIQINMIDF